MSVIKYTGHQGNTYQAKYYVLCKTITIFPFIVIIIISFVFISGAVTLRDCFLYTTSMKFWLQWNVERLHCFNGLIPKTFRSKHFIWHWHAVSFGKKTYLLFSIHFAVCASKFALFEFEYQHYEHRSGSSTIQHRLIESLQLPERLNPRLKGERRGHLFVLKRR